MLKQNCSPRRKSCLESKGTSDTSKSNIRSACCQQLFSSGESKRAVRGYLARCIQFLKFLALGERGDKGLGHTIDSFLVLQPGTLTPTKACGGVCARGGRGFLFCVGLSCPLLLCLHTPVLLKLDGDILNGARCEYRRTRTTQTEKCRHSFSRSPHAHTNTH